MSHKVLASIDCHLSPHGIHIAERVLERVGKVTRRLSNVFEVQTTLEPSRVHSALRQELDPDVRVYVSYIAAVCAS